MHLNFVNFRIEKKNIENLENIENIENQKNIYYLL